MRNIELTPETITKMCSKSN